MKGIVERLTIAEKRIVDLYKNIKTGGGSGGSQDLQSVVDNGGHIEYSEAERSSIATLNAGEIRFDHEYTAPFITSQSVALTGGGDGSTFFRARVVWIADGIDTALEANPDSIFNSVFRMPIGDGTIKTLATLEDITGGSQDLQSVLDAGNTVTGQMIKFDDGGASSNMSSDGMFVSNTVSNQTHVFDANGSIIRSIIGTETLSNFLGRTIYSDYDLGITTSIDFTTGNGNYHFPNKTIGDYILATLDDISVGGNQDLQSVLAVGNDALYPDGSRVSLANGDDGDRVSSITTRNSNGYGTIGSNPAGSSMTATSSTTDEQAYINVNHGNGLGNITFNVSKDAKNSSIVIPNPTLGNNTISFPDKPDGTYTLATLDDITWQNSLDNNPIAIDSEPEIHSSSDADNYIGFTSQGFNVYRTEGSSLGFGGSTSDLIITGVGLGVGGSNIMHWTDRTVVGAAHYSFKPDNLAGNYILATTNQLPSSASASISGLVNNTSLQELGGVDKLIHGVRIGKGNSSGTDNTVFGVNSQGVATTASENSSFGFEALKLVTTGSYISAFGWGALKNNTIGSSLNAFGDGALLNNIGGLRNNAFGTGALQGNIGGVDNNAFGDNALGANLGDENLAIGSSALVANTTGGYNLAIGNGALGANVLASQNIAIGAYSLYRSAGTGSLNGNHSLAIGVSALEHNLTGNGIGLGNYSLYNQTTGLWNIAIGFQSGSGITIGNNNVIIAGTGAVTVGGGITTGSNNLIVAQNDGNTTGITTGSGNTIIGKVIGLAANLANTVILSDGVGTRRFVSDSTNLSTLPVQTVALINADVTGKSIITKEYVNTEAGQVKVNYTGLSSTGFVLNTTKILDINAATPTIASSPTTTYPASTPNSYVGFFDSARGAGPTGRLIENPVAGQVHTWRFQVSYTNKASGNNGSLDIILTNPVSGFQFVLPFTLPTGRTSGVLNLNAITIADSASIPSPQGYILQAQTSFTDANLVVEINSITRISEAIKK